MSKATRSSFVRVLNGETVRLPPVWLMRQAGRYLPEYRKVREQAGSFLNLCFDPALASEVTLQPIRRYDLDAAIIFADILLIPYALGLNLRFETGEGPVLDRVEGLSELDALRNRRVADVLSPVFETVALTRRELPTDKALIGFAGAPWTVATYMLAGGPMNDPSACRRRYYEDDAFVQQLIEILTDLTIEYLRSQADAGADALQLFDSWAGGLPESVLEVVSVKPLSTIVEALKQSHPHVPTVIFPKGVGEKARLYADIDACAAVGVDHTMSFKWVRDNLSPHTVVQGGLDPMLVTVGGPKLQQAVDAILEAYKNVPYIFNLGHGLTPDTPPEHVAALVDRIRGK